MTADTTWTEDPIIRVLKSEYAIRFDGDRSRSRGKPTTTFVAEFAEDGWIVHVEPNEDEEWT